jgi:SAM-dependent methyltransferase
VTSSPPNRWTGGLGTFWAAHDDRYETMLAPFTAPLLDAAGIGPGDRVLDVGCGPGRTTREAARRAGPTGSALGVDLSPAMVARARELAAAQGPPTVSFTVADAGRADLGDGTYDVVISRFGVMFFDDEAAAFAGLTRALRPGGRLAFVCWRERERSSTRTVRADALAPWVPLPDPPAPGLPGPFTFADPARVRSVLTAAGLVDLGVDALEVSCLMGTDAADAAAFQIAEEDAERDEPLPPEAGEAMRAALAPYETAEGVLLDSSTWLVTATRP